MNLDWRETAMNTRIATIIGCAMVVISGCQSWSPSSFQMPTGTRVPPPPTGSYQHQGSYYNNPVGNNPAGTITTPTKTSALSTPSNLPNAGPTASTTFAPVVQASAVRNIDGNGGMPATSLGQAGSNPTNSNLGAASIAFQGNESNVQTAGHSEDGTGASNVVKADFVRPNTANEGANLQWR